MNIREGLLRSQVENARVRYKEEKVKGKRSNKNKKIMIEGQSLNAS
jgi:hypothetical protein